MSNYIEATMHDLRSQEVNELAARLKRMNIEDTFQRNRKLGEASASKVILNPHEPNEYIPPLPKADNGNTATFECLITTESCILAILYHVLMFSVPF
ncbi:hypothetical protein BHYA_0030g00270 [Botrytis hyacinthi]|uniref:Uncharacterized protein n=1 Tax=Botrytis hyacinthi TaxID=278943 RepID=A0A4Z1H030_9HELO|nr:hypothetical protein BHYA_0030g00270 [Botrytis hyacinthi]